MSTREMPTKAQHLASVIEGKGKSEYVAVARPVLLRLGEHQLAEVDAMAKLSGKSRNAMVAHLLDAGIEEVRQAMDDEALSTLNHEILQVHIAFSQTTAERETLEA